MENKHKVSVVMPVYNGEKYLKEAIESVLSQSLYEFEFIIVDDGSVDRTPEIISGYDDYRIRYIRNEHSFIESLNKGMNMAKSSYIARMDADDRMLPQRLQRQYDYMETHKEIGVCGSWFSGFNEEGSRIYRLSENNREIKAQLLISNAMAHSTVMIRRSCLMELTSQHIAGVYNPDYIYAEYYKLWCELAEHEVVIVNIPEVLMEYRYSQDQVTRKHYHRMLYQTKRVRNGYFNFIAQRLSEKIPESFELWNELIRLSNMGLLDFDSLMNMARIFYINIESLDEKTKK